MTKYLTAEGLEKLKKELDHLEKVRRKEVSERIRHTASQGDLKENAGYDAAKEEQAFVEGRIRELKEIVNQGKVIEKKVNNLIQIGSFVSLISSGEKQKLQIVSPEEANIMDNKISFESPLGKQLMGKKKGQRINIDTPGGKREYNIIEIK